MSPEIDGLLPWRRHRFHLPKRINRPWSNLSPVFRFEDVEWYLQCEQTSCGTIRLWLHSSSEQPPSFIVSVRVESGDGAEPYSKELLDVVDDWTSWPAAIWMRQARELELLLPEFQWDRFLTFWIAIKKKDPQRSSNSASHFPEGPRSQPKTFADASVQTISTPAAAFDPCLHSLSEDIGKLLDPCSNPDVEIRCAGHTARSHKNVLCVRSPVLARMIQQQNSVERTHIDIRDMNADTFRLFVKYLHTGKLKLHALSFDAALRLYEAGDTYGVKSLSQRCRRLLTRNLTVLNACDALAVASAHGCEKFAEAATAYIVKMKIPQTDGECWRNFCESHPVLSNKVYRRFLQTLTNSEPPTKRLCTTTIKRE